MEDLTEKTQMEDAPGTEQIRSRDECEQQLTMELALGAATSIDKLVKQGHETACEYVCQLPFDSLRKEVAIRPGLPNRIVQHLLKDPKEAIRLTVAKSNWETLTNEQQNNIAEQVTQALRKEKEKHNGMLPYWGSNVINMSKGIVEKLLSIALEARNSSLAQQYFETLDSPSLPYAGVELIKTFREMPDFCKYYWDTQRLAYREAILAHPDEAVRLEEVRKILNKHTKTSSLSMWRNLEGRLPFRPANLKEGILHLWVKDPSEKIRKYIVETSTNVEVLKRLSEDESPTIARKAHINFKRYQKRREYSRKYNERKKNATARW